MDGPVQSQSSCAMDTFPVGNSTYVHTGGKTSCIAGDPYRFEVIPGSLFRNNVIVFFQGGGGK